MARKIQILVASMLIVFFVSPLSAREVLTEIEAKAGFITNFIAFTRWAPELPKSKSFRLCIAGQDPYSTIFEHLPNASIKGRSLKILKLKDETNISTSNCHVLFIRLKEKKAIKKILTKVEKSPILTISEVNDYVNQKSMINLTTNNNKIAFSINRTPSDKVGIKFSSGMLRLAEKVLGGDK